MIRELSGQLNVRGWSSGFSPTEAGYEAWATKFWRPAQSHNIISHGSRAEDALTFTLVQAIKDDETFSTGEPR